MKRRWVRITAGRDGAYSSWRGMCERCSYPKHIAWAQYGGRGISVFPEWTGRGGFERFFAFMGTRPRGMSIDRIDSNGNYEPGNVRWADKYLQAGNQSANTLARRAERRRLGAIRRAKWALERFGHVMSLRDTERMANDIRAALESEFGATPTWIPEPKQLLCVEESFLAGEFSFTSDHWEGMENTGIEFAGHGTWEQLTGKAARLGKVAA